MGYVRGCLHVESTQYRPRSTSKRHSHPALVQRAAAVERFHINVKLVPEKSNLVAPNYTFTIFDLHTCHHGCPYAGPQFQYEFRGGERPSIMNIEASHSSARTRSPRRSTAAHLAPTLYGRFRPTVLEPRVVVWTCHCRESGQSSSTDRTVSWTPWRRSLPGSASTCRRRWWAGNQLSPSPSQHSHPPYQSSIFAHQLGRCVASTRDTDRQAPAASLRQPDWTLRCLSRPVAVGRASHRDLDLDSRWNAASLR